MANGGKRPGAGRPLGSKNKYSIHDYFTKKDVKAFLAWVKDSYMDNPKVAVWLGDHVFGKAQQSVDLTSGGKPLLITDDDA